MFIKLTEVRYYEIQEIFVNPVFIGSFIPWSKDLTRVYMGEGQIYYDVKETPEQILKLIKEAGNEVK